MKYTFLLIIGIVGTVSMIQAQAVETYTWPVDSGQAVVSNTYEVYVREGNGPEQALQVLMSEAIHEGDFRTNELAGRTFSFVNISYNKLGSPGLTFRVVKTFGTDASHVAIAPKSYQITPTLLSGKEITFSVNDHNRYLSINFLSADNDVTLPNFMASKGVKWIQHMLCIFIDPPAPNKPSGAGVVTFSPTVSPLDLENANTIVFPAGYHNLTDYDQGGIIDQDGVLTIQDEQAIYIEGGALVEGIIGRDKFQDDNQRIYGRGILTGRQYLWRSHPDHTGREYGELLRMGAGQLEGIMLMESPNHGIVGTRVHVENLKYLGWHANNDGIRIGSGSEVEHSFLRCVDDHFYNFDIYVHDCVLWAGHNGSIMTYGWGGTATSNTYNSGSSFMDNVDIIHPEWSGLGNNNGLIMSQTGLDYAPFGYGGPTTTHFRNIRIEGLIPGLTNLKPRSQSSDVNIAVQVEANVLGYMGDLILEDITVETQFEKGRLRGLENATTSGNQTYFVQNIKFDNIQIGGRCVTEQNKGDYFDIEANTTRDITFENCTLTPRDPLSPPVLSIYPNPTHGELSLVLPPSFSQANIDLYSSTGRHLKGWTSQGTSLALSVGDLSAGLYLLVVSTPEGGQLKQFFQKL